MTRNQKLKAIELLLRELNVENPTDVVVLLASAVASDGAIEVTTMFSGTEVHMAKTTEQVMLQSTLLNNIVNGIAHEKLLRHNINLAPLATQLFPLQPNQITEERPCNCKACTIRRQSKLQNPDLN